MFVVVRGRESDVQGISRSRLPGETSPTERASGHHNVITRHVFVKHVMASYHCNVSKLDQRQNVVGLGLAHFYVSYKLLLSLSILFRQEYGQGFINGNQCRFFLDYLTRPL